MKTISYVVALVGLVAIGLGVYWLVKADHHYRQYISLAAGVILLIAGLVGAFVIKPKSSAQAA